MKTFLTLSLLLAGLATTGPASAEPRRKCDVDANRLSGTFLLIAPDGRFCEASAEEERLHTQMLDASQQAAETQAEAERAAAVAKFKTEMRRSMIAGGATAADADRAIAEALGAPTVQPDRRVESRPARGQQRQAQPALPGASGKCMGRSGKDGTPCVPVPNMSGIGNAIASRGLGY